VAYGDRFYTCAQDDPRHLEDSSGNGSDGCPGLGPTSCTGPCESVLFQHIVGSPADGGAGGRAGVWCVCGGGVAVEGGGGGVVEGCRFGEIGEEINQRQAKL